MRFKADTNLYLYLNGYNEPRPDFFNSAGPTGKTSIYFKYPVIFLI